MAVGDVRRGELTTGEFGRRSGLSVKALRLYDVSGLLCPARVDSVTGYRWYAVEQLARARRISLLRQLEMPLAVIGELLALSDEEAVLRLERWWAAQEAAVVARRGTLSQLRGELLRAAVPEVAFAVAVRRVPEVKVAALRFEVDQQGLVAAMRLGEDVLRRHLAASGVGPGGSLRVLYLGPVTPDCAAPIEVCVPFSGGLEPARTEVFCTVLRDDCFYPRIMSAYAAVDGFVRDAGLVAAGPVREVYLADWDAVAGDGPYAEVAMPVEGWS
ncbi:MerR family transcriptional regulator [Catellatospora bangladeshensis]|uniref:MerR family transcriptional regulator n=1 Tax=Catellatospora bangladeshensis TaxID=310355 RepID=A0A8J3JLT8_9ACTN|nr:MerR family transcriptional regulator [Catellatospora bangladeshensis]GIF80284.1 MerR family transcriptional regulator [Catellatospora bangladeshensis]